METNPPAFPSNELRQEDGGIYKQHPGMSLLDHFAGLAMQAYCAHLTHGGFELGRHNKEIAKESYAIAEAMLDESALRLATEGGGE